MEETMDRKGLKFDEVEGSKQRKRTHGPYRGLEYDLDLLQEAGVRKVKGMRGIYRSLKYQADFLTGDETTGVRGIYRGVAYERESLPEKKLEAMPLADQADPEAETINQIIPPNRTDGGEIFLSARE
jgi:nitrogen regulatory protein PII